MPGEGPVAADWRYIKYPAIAAIAAMATKISALICCVSLGRDYAARRRASSRFRGGTSALTMRWLCMRYIDERLAPGETIIARR
jgi:hypothetical protein